MRRVFVDTVYWIALIDRKDQWHRAAIAASQVLGDAHLVTTDEVLTEVLNAFCEGGGHLRREVIAFVLELRADPAVSVEPQSRATFDSGLALYQARLDKQYSLTDCISMATMRGGGIVEVLTRDGHFTQEGFVVLMR